MNEGSLSTTDRSRSESSDSATVYATVAFTSEECSMFGGVYRVPFHLCTTTVKRLAKEAMKRFYRQVLRRSGQSNTPGDGPGKDTGMAVTRLFVCSFGEYERMRSEDKLVVERQLPEVFSEDAVSQVLDWQQEVIVMQFRSTLKKLADPLTQTLPPPTTSIDASMAVRDSASTPPKPARQEREVATMVTPTRQTPHTPSTTAKNVDPLTLALLSASAECKRVVNRNGSSSASDNEVAAVEVNKKSGSITENDASGHLKEYSPGNLVTDTTQVHRSTVVRVSPHEKSMLNRTPGHSPVKLRRALFTKRERSEQGSADDTSTTTRGDSADVADRNCTEDEQSKPPSGAARKLFKTEYRASAPEELFDYTTSVLATQLTTDRPVPPSFSSIDCC